MERRIETRQILNILTLFLIVQFGGLLLTVIFLPPSYIQIAQIGSGAQQNSSPSSFIISIILAIIVGVVIINFLLRLKSKTFKGDLFFKLLEAYIIIFGFFAFFWLVISNIFQNISLTTSSIASFLLAVLVVVIKNKTKRFRNAITMIASLGAGVILGISFGISFGFIAVYAIMAIFAVYDYLAVFVFKFMVPFAKELASRNLAFMVGDQEVEVTPLKYLTSKDKNEYKKIKMEDIKDPAIKRIIKQGNMPALSSVMLGNGDLMLPLMLTTGIYISFFNVFLSVATIIGAGAGLIFTMMLLKKYKVGLPAIPPLFAFISFALLLVFLISTPFQPLLILIFFLASTLSLMAMLLTLRRIRKATNTT